jgi:PIN domain nuclease of toxin-antitoxin system
VILIDTHVVVWLSGERKRLSQVALAAIAGARADGGGIAVSDVTLWELAMLATRRRINLPDSLEAFLRHVEENFVVLPVSGKIAARGAQFAETYPRDPMDRIIGATAIIEGLTLVTADEKIRASGEVTTVW